MNCSSCGKPINTVDVGATRKFISKASERYSCRDCLAQKLGWSRTYLDELILMYRKRGCLLFPPMENEGS